MQIKIYQATPTVPTTTTALTWIFNAQIQQLTISASIACLCCVTFVDGLPVAALPDMLSRHFL
jgi:uncharacterized membrane protein YjjB (DUF3815 family)